MPSKYYPCKKCGSTDIVFSDSGYRTFNCGEGHCKSCGNAISAHQVSNEENQAIEDTIREWNRQNAPPTAVELIDAERKRQVLKEGWDASHDDSHTDQSLAYAAACYAAPVPLFRKTRLNNFKSAWPWGAKWDKRKKHDRLRSLVIAGALICAEIDRIQRATKGGEVNNG